MKRLLWVLVGGGLGAAARRKRGGLILPAIVNVVPSAFGGIAFALSMKVIP